MTALHQALHEYLAVRRGLGFKLFTDGRLLPGFIDYLERTSGGFITTAAAMAWAIQPRTAHPAWWTKRLVMVRGFAKHLQARDPRHQVPPLDALSHRRPRSAPYIYQPGEIDALMRATAILRSPLQTATYRALLGLLAVTGLRIGEALALDDSDVDRRAGVLVVRKAKFGKTREVPLHPTTTQALRQYARDRDRLAPRRTTPSFLVSTAQARLRVGSVHRMFRRIVDAAGLGERRPRRPRIHDLRHTLAVHTLLRWHRAGDDVEAKLPLLSTFLGHISAVTTYWYLTAVPELLAAATARLERAMAV